MPMQATSVPRRPARGALFTGRRGAAGILTACVALLALMPGGGTAQAQTVPGAQTLIAQAAQALGAERAVRQVQTLQLYGFGENNAQDGGGNISAEAHAPQKRTALDGIVRSIDYTHGRMHLHQQQVQLFEFARANLMAAGNAVEQGLDGDVAFNVGGGFEAAAGPPRTVRAGAPVVRARRLEMLDNPLSIVRAALEGAQLGNVRRSGGDWLVDMRSAQGEQVTVAFAADTHLPRFLRWVAPHPVYGDLTHTTWFTGYEPIGNGLVLPFGYQTVCDYHDIVESEVYVDKYVVDGLSAAQRTALAAPAQVRAQRAAPPVISIDATRIAPHVWYLHSSANGSSTVFDFTDHLAVFEAYGSEQNFEAILAKIHQVLPGKPVTTDHVASSSGSHRWAARGGGRGADRHHQSRCERGLRARSHLPSGASVAGRAPAQRAGRQGADHPRG